MKNLKDYIVREGFLRKNLGLGREELIRKWCEDNKLGNYNINSDLTISICLDNDNDKFGYFLNPYKSIPDYIKFKEIDAPGFQYDYNTINLNSNTGNWESIWPESIYSSETDGVCIILTCCSFNDKELKMVADSVDLSCLWLDVINCTNLNSPDITYNGKHFGFSIMESDIKQIKLDIDVKTGQICLSGNKNLSKISGKVSGVKKLYIENTPIGSGLLPKGVDISKRSLCNRDIEETRAFKQIIKVFGDSLKHLYFNYNGGSKIKLSIINKKIYNIEYL